MSALGSTNFAAEAPAFKFFFDFPLEIRRKILASLVISNEDILFTTQGVLRTPWCFRSHILGFEEDEKKDQVHDGPYQPSVWPLNYFLANKHMYREARTVLLEKNVFKINCHAFHYQFHKASDIQGATILLPKWTVLKQLRQVILDINSKDDFQALDYVRRASLQLKDMYCFGRLIRLEVCIDWWDDGEDYGLVAAPFLWDSWSDSDRVIATFGPQLKTYNGPDVFWEAGPQLLLNLLSDPRLRIARLKVAAHHHPQEWCEYHEESESPRETAGRSALVSVDCTAAPMVSCRSLTWNRFLATDMKALAKSVSVPAPPSIAWADWQGV